MKNFIWILIFSLTFTMLYAGSIDDVLLKHLEALGDNQKIECMIVMTEQFDSETFRHTMTMANSARQERHYHVISSLQEIAARTQPALLTFLENRRINGDVDEYQGYWISNNIYARLTKDIILEISQRSDVDIIYYWQEPELVHPVSPVAEPPSVTRVENGLNVIGASQAWAMGLTGAERLVANVDTGVDGNHPALNSRWRGNNGATAQESWLDTANPGSSFPYDTDSHGTHTMGTITGLGLATGDTIGVAIDAQWIAARAIVTNGNISLAYQWLADPDGNPTTIDDVPDVICNSWGYHDFSCPTYVWAYIDYCEMAGIVVLFAAGNRLMGDPLYESVWAPASRISTPYNTFAVGSVNGNNSSLPIASSSGRGPSQCDHLTIKPEVVAPGVSVRSSVPGSGYGYKSGTSMACPHVAGAIAILRQLSPEASVDTIKWALMESAVDLGQVGEDNDYGYGIINIPAAVDLVPYSGMPDFNITGFIVTEPGNNFPDPGDTVNLVVTLSNTGTGAINAYTQLLSPSSQIQITSDSSYYGVMFEGDIKNNTDQPFEIIFDQTIPNNTIVPFTMTVYGNGFTTDIEISILVGSIDTLQSADHGIGNVDYTVSNFGIYGLSNPDFYPAWNGQGFRYPRSSDNFLWEGALFIGDGPIRVSNGARDHEGNIASDFIPVTGIALSQPGQFGDQEYSCVFNDQNALNPLNITIHQTSFAWATQPDDQYIITEYKITNNSADTLTGVKVAHYEDWNTPWSFPQDQVGFDRTRNLGYQYETNVYRGLMVLNPEGAIAFRALHNSSEVNPPAFTLSDKWSYMNAGFTDTAITTPEDASMMMTTGPFDIYPGYTITAAFGILGADNLTDLSDVADAAIIIYNGMTHANNLTDIALPESFGIAGNYPNPFNPITRIKYSTDSHSFINLDIYDILGRKVKSLVSNFMIPGIYETVWDGCDYRDCNVSSGVYFVRIVSDQKSDSRKILLLR